jgi:hypothetical protein
MKDDAKKWAVYYVIVGVESAIGITMQVSVCWQSLECKSIQGIISFSVNQRIYLQSCANSRQLLEDQ